MEAEINHIIILTIIIVEFGAYIFKKNNIQKAIKAV